MKIPAPAATTEQLEQLYADLATALNALEEAGEHPLRSLTHFGDGTIGTVSDNGVVRRIDTLWVSRIDYSDFLHNEDGTHRSATTAAGATFPTVVAAFEVQMPEHLAAHARADND